MSSVGAMDSQFEICRLASRSYSRWRSPAPLCPFESRMRGQAVTMPPWRRIQRWSSAKSLSHASNLSGMELTLSIETNASDSHVEVAGAPFAYDSSLQGRIADLVARVREMRKVGELSPDVLRHIRRHFRIKTIYHSNAIEGNLLDIGETRLVVEAGLTIAGKPLKDQAEAKNLGEALDFLEELARSPSFSLSSHDIRQIHQLILKGIDTANAGAYRTVDVAISGSAYKPPDPHEVAPMIDDLTSWLGAEGYVNQDNVLQVAAACHAWFAQIHPFVDGNGRTARILMNLLLMRAGFPIAVITREDRVRYIDALERSQISDLTPFIALLLESIEETLEEYELAAQEQLEQTEWASDLASRFSEPAKVHASNEYELWRSSMDLLLSHYRQVVEDVNAASPVGKWYVKDMGMLPFEKYLALRERQSAKRTWFFRVDFNRGDKAVRYLHWFGFASYAMTDQSNAKVSLILSREEQPFFFEKLDDLKATNVPLLREIAYSPRDEAFIARYGPDRCRVQKIEDIARAFFDSVVSLHFQS